MNLTFIIFNIPMTAVYIVKNVYLNSGKNRSRLTLSKIDFAWDIAFYIFILYHVLFFFFNLYFNKLFRGEIVKILSKNNEKNKAMSCGSHGNSNLTTSNKTTNIHVCIKNTTNESKS